MTEAAESLGVPVIAPSDLIEGSPRSATCRRRYPNPGLASSHADDVRLVLGRLAFIELASPVLARALEPFPTPVRTFDGLQLASIDFLRSLGQRPTLATHDHRMTEAAASLGVSVIAP